MEKGRYLFHAGLIYVLYTQLTLKDKAKTKKKGA